MIEEEVLNWEKILTVLIGIVIVASIYLVIYRRRKVKRKNIEQEADLLKSNKLTDDTKKF